MQGYFRAFLPLIPDFYRLSYSAKNVWIVCISAIIFALSNKNKQKQTL